MTDAISLGIDLGTSELKGVLLDGKGIVLAQAAAALSNARPQPGWSEQNQVDWWLPGGAVLHRVRDASPAAFARNGCVGLSGQMHGAVLVDRRDDCIRPAIQRNDSRAIAESAAFE